MAARNVAARSNSSGSRNDRPGNDSVMGLLLGAVADHAVPIGGRWLGFESADALAVDAGQRVSAEARDEFPQRFAGARPVAAEIALVEAGPFGAQRNGPEVDGEIRLRVARQH